MEELPVWALNGKGVWKILVVSQPWAESTWRKGLQPFLGSSNEHQKWSFSFCFSCLPFPVSSHPWKTLLQIPETISQHQNKSVFPNAPKSCTSRTEKTLFHPFLDTILKFMRMFETVGFMNTSIFPAYFIKSILLYALPEFIVGHIQNFSDSKKIEQEGRKRPVKSYSLTLFQHKKKEVPLGRPERKDTERQLL